MQYALIDGKRVEAFPNSYGLCICCNQPTYSACGKFITWHWRHKNKKLCDPWWEAESEWHREWKSHFPEGWREIVHYDDSTGEKHIADVKTDNGIVLEFQNSPITLLELGLREKFYKNMIWIINAQSFKANFIFGCALPDPASDFPSKYRFMGYKHPIVYDHSVDGDQDMVQIFSYIDNVALGTFIEKYHTRHYNFEWKNKRRIWFTSIVPMYLDFGEGILWEVIIDHRLGKRPICAWHLKKDFIASHLSF